MRGPYARPLCAERVDADATHELVTKIEKVVLSSAQHTLIERFAKLKVVAVDLDGE